MLNEREVQQIAARAILRGQPLARVHAEPAEAVVDLTPEQPQPDTEETNNDE